MDRQYPQVNSQYPQRDYYQMLENARRESVNRNAEEARKREIKAQRRKRAIRFHRIEGAVLAVVIMASTYFTVPKVVDAFTDYTNDSYHAGYHMVQEETHRTDDYQNFWFDYSDIADGYEAGMDFDSYVYGVYNRILGSGSGRTMINMDDFFYQMYRRGYTEYSSFEDYCLAHGFSKEKDGKVVVDTDKYESAARDYLKDLKAIEDKQEEVQSFRGK